MEIKPPASSAESVRPAQQETRPRVEEKEPRPEAVEPPKEQPKREGSVDLKV